jgi:hypothetical protein
MELSKRERQAQASKKWKLKNRDAINAYARRWRKANPEKTHAAYLRHKPKVNQKEQYKRSLACEDRDPARRLRYRAMRHAYERGIDFSMKSSDIDLPERCPVFGYVLDYSRDASKSRLPHSATIDRVHNHLGYVAGNVVVVSWRANRLKNDASITELHLLSKFYSQYVAR